MALPPRAAAAPAEDMAAAEPALETTGVGEPMEEGADPWMPVATVLKNSETGEFMVLAGDEPDDGSMPEGPTFPDGPSVLREMMGLLEGAPEADKAFAAGFEGSAKKPPMAA